ncbi:MAG TPA: Flp family type IVb pilin [Candidatus Ozemobacteraceae bacterium]
MKQKMSIRLSPRSGQGLVEYTLVIALVALALISILTVVGQIINNNYLANFGKILDAVVPSGS